MEKAVSNGEAAKDVQCDIFEIEPGELTEDAVRVDECDADSFRAVDMLAALERRSM